MRKRTTLITVLLFSLIGAVVFSFVSNVIYFQLIKKTSDQEIISNSEDTTNLAFDNIDRSFLSIANVSSICLSNCNKYKKSAYEYNTKAITDNIKELEILLLSHPTIDAVDMYFPQEKIAITNSEKIHFDVSDSSLYSFLPWLKVYEEQNNPSLILRRGFNAYPIDSKSITYITKTPVFSNNPDAILAIHITPSFFSEYIKEDEEQHFMLFDKDVNYIYETDSGTKYNQDVAKILKETTLKGFEIESKIVKIKNQSYLLTMKQSSAFSLRYVYLRPLSTIINPFPFSIPLVITALILILLNLFTTYLVVIKNDKVYKKKLETLPISVGNNCKSFDKSIEAIHTKFNIINNSYNKVQPIVIQNRIRLLLLGRYLDITEEDFKKLFNKSHVGVAIIRFKKDTPQNDILNEFVNRYNNDSISCYRTSLENKSVFVFNSNEELIEQQIYSFENSIKEFDFGLYLSTVKKLDKEVFSTLYEEALSSYDYRYLLPDQKIIRYESLNIDSRLTEGNHNNLIIEIENAILNKNIALAQKVFELYITSLIDDSYTLEYTQSTILELVSLINRTIIKMGYDSFGIFGYDLRDYFKNIKSLMEYRAWMEVCLENLDEYISESSSTDQSLKEKINQVIQESAEKDLSLDYIADKLSIRSDELSKQFKNIYGINFSDYVRTLKINKAKQLLKDGYKVNEVASILGYSSSQYFIKIFKMETGSTPFTYSKNH